MDDDPLAKLSTSPDQWIELVETLSRALEAIKAPEWRPDVPDIPPHLNGDGVRRFIEHHLVEAYRLDAQLVLKNLLWLLQEGTWAEMPDSVVYHARAVLGTIRLYVMDLVVPGIDKKLATIVPFPKGSVPEVLLWFVTEWWTSSGLLRYAWQSSAGAGSDRQ